VTRDKEQAVSANRTYGILVVDDDRDFRESVQRLLWVASESLPARAFEAGRGDEAMSVLKKENIDCMLLDQRMPGGTGVEWIKRFLDACPNLAIVMVTGQGDEQTAVQAMKNGAADYLVKGAISAEALQRAITNAIEKVEMRTALLMAERQRVMIESLGAVCHHLGQPMATITTLLEIMKRQEVSPSLKKMMNECVEVVDKVDELLDRLQKVSTYSTEPYLPAKEGATPKSDERILKI